MDQAVKAGHQQTQEDTDVKLAWALAWRNVTIMGLPAQDKRLPMPDLGCQSLTFGQCPVYSCQHGLFQRVTH